MADYRKLYDKDFLGAWDLTTDAGARDVTVVIEAVQQGELQAPGKPKKRRAPVVSFVRCRKKLVLNVTNGRTIAALYGTDTRWWVGKAITLYATKTTFGRAIVDCIRVRPIAPGQHAAASPEILQPPIEVHGEVADSAAAAEVEADGVPDRTDSEIAAEDERKEKEVHA